MIFVWILLVFIIFFSIIYFNFLKSENNLSFLKAILFAGILNIPIFYMSIMAGAPASWIPGFDFLDWVIPLIWGVFVIIGWFRIKETIRKYIVVFLYLLSPAPLFLAAYDYPLTYIRFLFFSIVIVSLLVILTDRSHKHDKKKI